MTFGMVPNESAEGKKFKVNLVLYGTRRHLPPRYMVAKDVNDLRRKLIQGGHLQDTDYDTNVCRLNPKNGHYDLIAHVYEALDINHRPVYIWDDYYKGKPRFAYINPETGRIQNADFEPKRRP